MGHTAVVPNGGAKRTTWRPLALLSLAPFISLLCGFVSHLSAAARVQLQLLSGGPDLRPPRQKSRTQSLAVALSAFFYTIPCVAFARCDSPAFGTWHMLVALSFCCVVLTSLVADGSLVLTSLVADGSLVRGRQMQLLDRWCASTAGVLAFVTPFLEYPCWTLLVLLVTILPLTRARATPHSDTWSWVRWQSLWHLVSALTCAYFGPEGWIDDDMQYPSLVS
eukprot:g37530.t1